MTTDRAAIPGYGMPCPGEQDAVAALTRVLGEERARATWADACRAARVQRGAGELSPEQVGDVARQMAGGTGVARMIGNSILIRIRTYTLLSSRGGTEVPA